MTKYTPYILSILTSLLLFSVSCNKETVTETEKTVPLKDEYEFSAKVNGTIFISRFTEAWEDEGIAIRGEDNINYDELIIFIPGDSIGEYIMEPGNDESAGAGYKDYTTLYGGTGKISVKSRTDTSISGTFYFTAITFPSGTDTVRVTEGIFNVKKSW